MTHAATGTAVPSEYDALAPFYDEFTAHHDYELWLDGLLTLARRHGLSGRRALDGGCGTGKSLAPLIARGFEVTGCDASRSMLAVAEAKLPPGIELHCRDLRELGVLGEFDLITCLDDVANYMPGPEDLTRALAGLAANLRPGGVAVFDANTIATYRGFFRECVVVEAPGVFVTWRGRAPASFAAGDLAEATIDAFAEQGGCWSRTTSVHRQRHHPEAVVLRCIERAGLRCAAVYGQDPEVRFDDRLDELRHSKAVYVVTRSTTHEGR